MVSEGVRMARQDEQEETGSAPAKGNKTAIIIAVATIICVAIIAGGAVYYLKGQHAPAAAEGGATHGAEGKADPAKKKETPAMFPMEAFIVNISDGKDMRYLKVKVELESSLPVEVMKKEVEPYLARLRDSILVLLTTKTIQDVQDLTGKNKLRDEIMAAANKVVPAAKITAVYFTDFVVQ